MSHRTSRGTWVLAVSGLAAVIAISGATPALAAAGAATRTAAARASTGTLAGSVVRDVVAGAAVLIVLLAVLLVAMRSRQKRAAGEPGRGRPRGQHVQRRPGRDPVRNGPAGTGAAGHAATGYGAAGLPPRVASPPSGAPPAAVSWRPSGGWQGAGVGEIAARAVPAGPAVVPAPKPPRTGPGSPRKTAGPPWAPAPEPERLIGALPAVASSAIPSDPGPGIRVPGDMTSLASAPDGPPPEGFAPGPGAGRTSMGFAAAPVPADFVPPGTDVTTPHAPHVPATDFPTPAFPTPAFPTPDFTVPSRAAGFVLSGTPGPHADRPAPEPDFAPQPPADPSFIWDLAGRDVFPAADAGLAAPADHDSTAGQDPD